MPLLSKVTTLQELLDSAQAQVKRASGHNDELHVSTTHPTGSVDNGNVTPPTGELHSQQGSKVTKAYPDNSINTPPAGAESQAALSPQQGVAQGDIESNAVANTSENKETVDDPGTAHPAAADKAAKLSNAELTKQGRALLDSVNADMLVAINAEGAVLTQSQPKQAATTTTSTATADEPAIPDEQTQEMLATQKVAQAAEYAAHSAVKVATYLRQTAKQAGIKLAEEDEEDEEDDDEGEPKKPSSEGGESRESSAPPSDPGTDLPPAGAMGGGSAMPSEPAADMGGGMGGDMGMGGAPAAMDPMAGGGDMGGEMGAGDPMAMFMSMSPEEQQQILAELGLTDISELQQLMGAKQAWYQAKAAAARADYAAKLAAVAARRQSTKTAAARDNRVNDPKRAGLRNALVNHLNKELLQEPL